MDWDRFESAFSECYCPDFGAPAKSTRLMIGLHYLKHAFNESDESVVEKWVENPYWQYFCGYTHLQHVCPIHPTSMTKWRQRVGKERRLSDRFQAVVQGNRETERRGAAPRHPLASILPSHWQEMHGPTRAVCSCQTIQTDGAGDSDVANVCGSSSPGHRSQGNFYRQRTTWIARTMSASA